MGKTSKPGHYSFVIVASLFIQLFLAGSILMTAGMFILPVTTALNLTQGVYMLYLTIQYATMAVMGLFMPKLLSKFKFTSLNKVAIVVMALGAFCMAAAQNVVLIYAGGVLLGASMVVASYQSAAILIPRWFKTRVGVMLATATVGLTVAGAVISPVIPHPFVARNVVRGSAPLPHRCGDLFTTPPDSTTSFSSSPARCAPEPPSSPFWLLKAAKSCGTYRIKLGAPLRLPETSHLTSNAARLDVRSRRFGLSRSPTLVSNRKQLVRSLQAS